MELLVHSLQSERYQGCQISTLDPDALTEIGRVMAHHGLLVAYVREFVSYISKQTQRLPYSVGSKESIKLLPSVLERLKPVFSADDIHLLSRASDQLAVVREAVDRFHYSVWGAISFGPEKFGRTEYRRCKGAGCWRDQSIYSTSEIHKLAMEISLAIRYLGNVQGVIQKKIAEKPYALKKIFNQKRK